MGYAENKVEKYLKDKCEENGFLCYKIEFLSKRGAPDRCIIGNGYTIFVETKAPDGKPSKQQIFRIREMEDHGGNVRICYTREQCDTLLKQIIKGTFKIGKSCLPPDKRKKVRKKCSKSSQK